MRFRLWFITCITTALSICFCSCVFAKDSIKLLMNGEPVSLANYEPEIIDGQPMLPIRDTFTLLGAQVTWDAQNKAIIGKKDNMTITMFVGTDKYKVNDLNATMDATTVINDKGVALASAKYVLRGWRYQMDWNEQTKTLNILDWEHYNIIVEEKKKELAKLTTTTTVVTTAAPVTTTVETTTETTTTLQQVLNSGPVFGTDKRMAEEIIQDCKTLARGYSLGMADQLPRMKTAAVNNTVEKWQRMAKTDLDKQYITACAAVYRSFISRASALDTWLDSNKGSENRFKAVKYKEKLTDYLYSIGKCTTIDEINKLNTSINQLSK